MTRLIIISALMAEAVPLIDHYKMKKQPKLPDYHLYRGAGIDLIVCGMGENRVQRGLKAYLREVNVDAQTRWLNVGIAGTLSYTVGALIWANSVGGRVIARPEYCVNQQAMDVVSLRNPSADYRANTLFDMEAQSCLNVLVHNCVQFRPESHFFCAKVVSDNLSENMHRLSKQTVKALLRQNIMALSEGVKYIIKSTE